MKSFQKFLIITLIPLFLITICSFVINDEALDDIKNIKLITYSLSFFSILSFVYVYLFDSIYLKQKSIFNKLLISSFFTFFIIFIFGLFFPKFSFEGRNFMTSLFQATLGVCIFLLEYLVLNFYTNFNKNESLLFSDKNLYYFKIILIISFFEYVLLVIMTIDIFLQLTTFYQFLTYSYSFFLIPLVINISVFLSLKYLRYINFLKYKVILIIVFSTLLSLLFVNLFNLIRFKLELHDNLIYFILCMFSTLLLYTIIEYRDKLNVSKAKIRSLSNSFSKKESEYLQLKKQVNPHFLFNNLNILISFIEINPKKAIEFGHHLSNTYRHYLKYNDEDFVLLSVELTFIEEYLEIYKAKFENGFSFKIESQSNEKQYVLSFALQEIIDNIFKHNNFDEDNPIEIKVTTLNDNLHIRNSIITKMNVISNNLGIENIKKRYELLTNKTIHITAADTFFEVIFPILILEK